MTRANRRVGRAVLGLTVLMALLAGCASASSGAVSGARPGAKATATVWLCKPGARKDPCAASLDVTVAPGSGSRSVDDVTDATRSAFDCFYVYPTVSTETTNNANLKIQPAETDVAIDQASPFSQVCRVWAPMYRQVTIDALFKSPSVTSKALEVAYKSLDSAWSDYLAHDNHGRPIVFIGHSQGAAMLIRLLEAHVDNAPAVRSRMVSAVILGGNVAVPTGKEVGSTFHHLPLCTTSTQFGCVIAYSTFPSQPPADSLFGIPGQGVSLQSNQTARNGVQVACVNPADIGGSTAPLLPWFLASTQSLPAPHVTTPWVTYPGLYTSACETSGDATWLQVTDVAASGDDRPVVTETLGPAWGFHLYDVNLATANLVGDVRAEEKAYSAVHH